MLIKKKTKTVLFAQPGDDRADDSGIEDNDDMGQEGWEDNLAAAAPPADNDQGHQVARPGAGLLNPNNEDIIGPNIVRYITYFNHTDRFIV